MHNLEVHKLVIATNNEDKLNEIIPFLKDLEISILSKSDFPDFPEIEENGKNLEENALLKARGIYQATGIPVVADDTGLEVDFLNGAPGVYSSRYSGISASYDENIQKLLYELKEVSDDLRTAQFRCVIAFVDDNYEFTVDGVCKGKIIKSPKGKYGFGYDPVFYVPEFGKTFAQMPRVLKNKISHRGRALTKIKPHILQYLRKKVPNYN